MLSGNRTYLAVLVAVVYIIGGRYFKLWEVDANILAGIGFVAAAFLRAGIAKAHDAIESKQVALTAVVDAAAPLRSSEPRNDGLGTKVGAIALIGMACIALLFAATGCVTKPVVSTGTNGLTVTNFVKVPDVARISRVAGGAAQLGSQAWLAKNPNDRRYFVIANESLKGLADSANYDPAAFAQALSVLPMKELQGPEGSLIISGALLLWDEALASSTGLNRIELVAATLKKVQEGLQKALDATAPRSELMRDLHSRIYEQGQWHLNNL